MSQQKAIFTTEQKTLERAQRIRDDNRYQDNPLMPEFESLLEGYDKMFRQFRSLIRISDSQQKSLSDLNRRLAEANTSKDKFFSIISHDLRGPLGTLIGLSEMLHNQIEDAGKTEISELAEDVCSSARNVYALLKNLLTWSGIQRDAMEYHPEALEIEELIAATIHLLLPQAKEKGIELVSSVKQDIMVYADYNMLNTVFRNLISNAIKFTPYGGKIEISARAYGHTDIEMTVSDTGIGISQEDLDELFRIGVRHSGVGTAGEEGTGLGLVLCKALLDKNRGTIRVESRIRKGTRVILTLPGAGKGAGLRGPA